jgi:hypothetical protein
LISPKYLLIYDVNVPFRVIDLGTLHAPREAADAGRAPL